MCHFILPHSHDYLKKSLIKMNMSSDKSNSGEWSIYVFCGLPLLCFLFAGIQKSKLYAISSSCVHIVLKVLNDFSAFFL